jgi:hypothetical protein
MNAIEETTSDEPILLDALVKILTNFHQEKVLETVRYLLDNDKLHYNSTQQLEWKK